MAVPGAWCWRSLLARLGVLMGEEGGEWSEYSVAPLRSWAVWEWLSDGRRYPLVLYELRQRHRAALLTSATLRSFERFLGAPRSRRG